MDRSTHEVRLSHWKNVIQQCQARPEGVTAKQWLQENGIPNKQYYYWLRRVRRDLYQQTAHAAVMTVPMSPSAQKGSEDIAFAEIPAASFLTEAEGSEAFKPDIIIRTDTAVVAVSNSASKSLLRIVMKAVSHAG
jgi:putative transposase